MRVKELIEKLQQFDPELTVCYSDSEYGTYKIYDVGIIEDAWVYWDKATVLLLDGEDIQEEDVDPKYFRKQKRPVYRSSPINDLLAVAYQEQLQRTLSDTMLSRLGHPSNGVVEFKIIRGDDK